MTTDTIGGVWTYALELCEELSRRGTEIVLATMGELPDASQSAAARRIPGLELVSSFLRLEWMQDPWSDVERSFDWLRGVAQEFEPDLAHLNIYAHGALDLGIPSVLVGHSCVLSWWDAVHGEPAPRSWERYRETVAAGIAGADVVAAPSTAMLSALQRHYGPFAHGCVVPNGRDPRRFAVGRKRPGILCAGRFWDRAKNLEILGRVAPRLFWPIRIAGDDQPPQGVLRDVSATSRLQMLGRLDADEMASALAEASVFAHPAIYEPFGLSVLEAGLSGCALVLADIPTLRDLWDGAAAFFDPRDDQALVHLLNRLATQPILRGDLGWRARKRALSFGSDRMADLYLGIYRDACGRFATRSSQGIQRCAS